MRQTLFFRRSGALLLFMLLVLSGFIIGIHKVAAADLTITQCRALDANADCYFLTDIDPSQYVDLGTCTSGRRCMKPKPVGSACASPNKCETSCGGTEYYGNDVTQGTCSGGKLCCKPKDTCASPTGGCTATYAGNAAYDQHGYIIDGFCDGSGPKQCYKLAPATIPNEDPGSTIPNEDSGSTIPNENSTQTTTGGVQPISFENPLKYNTVQDVLGGLLTALQGIIVILSIIFIIIGALLYITSAGNDSQIKTAKAAITAAMIGLAIGIAAPSFLKEISTILGWNAAPANVSAALSLTAILTNVLTFLLGVVGILAIIMLVIGALMYLSAAGDEDRIDDGKKIVKFSIIGIIIAFAAMVIVKQIANFFL